jgi:hypothetical protein
MKSTLGALGFSALLLAATLSVLVVRPAAADDQCKPAGPLPQSKCAKDAQCCAGLVCAAAGSSINNATTQCQPGCHIGGAFQTAGQKNTATNNCQSCQPSRSTTSWSNLAAGTLCRPSAGECDLQETCTGTSGACPADAKKASGTACTADTNPCTLDQCNGTSNACQHPAGNAGAACRVVAGVCDVAETCTGTSSTCPADAFKSSSTVCRAAAGECDVAENCTGSSATCPPDTKQAPGTACTADTNPCTLDQCDGTNVTCQHPAGNAGTTCRAAAGACDLAENCDGSNTACPADAKAGAGTVCRSAAGDCDVAATCDGSNDTCPPNGLQPDGTPCTGGTCTAGACVTSTTTTTTTPTTATTTTTILGCFTSDDCPDQSTVCMNSMCVPCLAFGVTCVDQAGATPCCRSLGCNDRVPEFCLAGSGFCCHD